MDNLSEPAMEAERTLLRTIKTRRGKLCALTRKKNEVLQMMKTNEPKENVKTHVDTFNELLAEFMELQVTVQRKRRIMIIGMSPS